MTDDSDRRVLQPAHPGSALRRHCVEASGHSVREAARAMGVEEAELAAVLECRAPITPALAVRIAGAFGGSAEVWHALQADYEIETAMASAGYAHRSPAEREWRAALRDLGGNPPHPRSALKDAVLAGAPAGNGATAADIAGVRDALGRPGRIEPEAVVALCRPIGEPPEFWYHWQARHELSQALARADEFECRRLLPSTGPETERDAFDLDVDRRLAEEAYMQEAAEEAGLPVMSVVEFREMLEHGKLAADVVAAAERGRARFAQARDRPATAAVAEADSDYEGSS